MRLALVAAILGLLLLVTSGVEAGGKKKAKKKGAVLKGSIVSVQPSTTDAGVGSVVIKTAANKKKGTTGMEVTVNVSKKTTFERVSGKKGQKQTNQAAFTDVGRGAQVVIHTAPGRQGEAQSVQIMKSKKKKNA
jgi:hypothetical protein